MNRQIPIFLLACIVAGCSQPRAPAKPGAAAEGAAPKATQAAAPRAADANTSASTRLTIYSGDYGQLAASDGTVARGMPGAALVESKLRYRLKAGDNVVALERLPRALDEAGVRFVADSPATEVTGQRFVAALGGADAALSRAAGHRVSVEHTSGGAKQTDSGTLVAADGDGIVLALPDGRVKVIRQYDNFSVLDGGDLAAASAQLRWHVQAQRDGDATFSLSYPTGGLAWRAEYVATLVRGDGCSLSLDGAALVANRSGVAYPGVAMTLVAGEPNRAGGNAFAGDRIQVTGSRVERMDAGMPTLRPSGEYYAYDLPGTHSLGSDAIDRVPLFASASGVECERSHETAPRVGLWQPPRPLVAPGAGDTGPQPVRSVVAFDNTAAAGLGRPLPAGRVRVFEGADFVGESMLGHTPEGANVRLEVGTSFDLTARRERTGFRVDRAGHDMTESFEVALKNAGKAATAIVAVEPMPRWSDWEIVSSSVPARKRDAQHAAFTIEVPAGGESTLAYTVRYRWPRDVVP